VADLIDRQHGSLKEEYEDKVEHRKTGGAFKQINPARNEKRGGEKISFGITELRGKTKKDPRTGEYRDL